MKKLTMKELAKKYYWTTIADLWDELAEDKKDRKLSEKELAEVFAEKYNVSPIAVLRYFN